MQTQDNREGIYEGVITCFKAGYMDSEAFWEVIDNYIHAEHDKIIDFINLITEGSGYIYSWLEPSEAQELIGACPSRKPKEWFGEIDITCEGITASENMHSWTTSEYGRENEKMYTVYVDGVEAHDIEEAVKKACLSDSRICDYMEGWKGSINTDKIMNVDLYH